MQEVWKGFFKIDFFIYYIFYKNGKPKDIYISLYLYVLDEKNHCCVKGGSQVAQVVR